MNAIIKKELNIYFKTPIAWIFIAVMICVGSIFFTLFNLFDANSSVSVIFSLLPWVFVIMIPLLTMRLIAEERSLKTDQLLLTAPISVSSIVWGKLVAALAVFGISILLMLIFPVILMFYAKIEWGTVVSNYLGFFLMGAALISVGIFVSSLTENQFTAGIITIAVLLAMFIFSSADFVVGIGAVDYVLSLLKILNHFDAFFIGVINIVDVLYYASIAVIFALLTIYRMEKRRIK